MLLSLLLTFGVQLEAPSPTSVTFHELSDGLSDLGWLLQRPQAGERVETLDLKPVEGEALSLHVEGSGALARLWLSQAVGRLELEIDGERLEVLPQELAAWVAQAADQESLPLWQRRPLMTPLGHGFSSHLPLPFAETLELRWLEAPAGARLQASVRRFGDRPVRALTTATLKEEARVLRRVLRELNSPDNPEVLVQPPPFKVGGARFRPETMAKTTTNGEFRWPISGHGVMQWFTLEFIHKEAPAPTEEMLRSLILRVEEGSADLEEPGKVLFRVPLGDFFGSSPGEQDWQSPWMGFRQDLGQFYFRLPIPYRNGLKLCVESEMLGIARFRMRAGLDPVADPAEVPPLRLHAGWVHGRGRGTADRAELQVEGPARLAALSFAATSPSVAPMRHDGPFAFASAWDLPQPQCYEQLTRWDGPGQFGRSSMVRLFTWDAPTAAAGEPLRIPVGVVLPAEEEVDYSAFAWWYGPAEQASNWDDAGDHEARLVPPMPAATFHVVDGAMESEQAAGILTSPGSGLARRELPAAQGFSHCQVLEWQPARAGDLLVLPFPVRQAGRYEVELGVAKGAARGQLQCLVDGRAFAELIDAHGEGDDVALKVDLGELRLMPRLDHKFAVKSLDGKAVALDYLRLVPVKEAADSGGN